MSIARSQINSLPEFMNFKLFGKTILVVNRKFELFVGPSTQEVSLRHLPHVSFVGEMKYGKGQVTPQGPLKITNFEGPKTIETLRILLFLQFRPPHPSFPCEGPWLGLE